MAMSELKQKLLLYELAKIGFRDAQYHPITDRIHVQPDNNRMPTIGDMGNIQYKSEYDSLAVNTLRPIVDNVNEALTAWEKSGKMPFEDLKQFRVLAEYNKIIFAARDDTEHGHGLHFATWQYNYDRTGLDHGHYTENYTAAKEDFAGRSGLISELKLFTQEQAAEIKASIDYRIENDDSITYKTEIELQSIAARLRAAYPTNSEKDSQNNRGHEIETQAVVGKTTDTVNNELHLNDWVVIVPSDAFGNLVGKVVSITPSDSPEHTADVHISVADSGYSENEMNNIRHFIAGYGGDGASVDDFIVTNDSLINITDLAPALRQSFIENGAEADAYCNQVMSGSKNSEKAEKSAESKKPKKTLVEKMQAAKEKIKAQDANGNKNKANYRGERE